MITRIFAVVSKMDKNVSQAEHVMSNSMKKCMISDASHTYANVHVVLGPVGSGKSTFGLRLLQQFTDASVPAAYIDGDTLKGLSKNLK